MAKVLEMPKLSPTMEEGQISVWHKKAGDPVAVDDLLAEVETDKATMEFRSFDKGTLLELLVPAGSVVRLGQPVAILGTPGEDVSALVAQHGAAAPAPAPAAPPPAPAPAAPQPGTEVPGYTNKVPTGLPSVPSAPSAPSAPLPLPLPLPSALSPLSSPPSPSGRIKASPYVRKLARERGLDLSSLPGSGPNGRIIARDLDRLPAAPAAPAAPAELAAPEARPLSMMRKAIARRLTESKQTVPHFYLSIDVDADPLHHLREQINADLSSAAPAEATKVSFNDLLVKACAVALVRVPECNATFTPEAILVHRRVDISVAVAVPEGLLTPVVRDADHKSVLEISAEVRDLGARAKAKKLKPDEMANGTFSISNLGMYGIDAFAAVINPPEGAILAVGQVRREPVVRGESVVPGRKLALTLSCDHRVVDGAVGATFLKELRRILEHPTQILLA
jgi:pyruvate dehydrogenase E2 component (dihydrolipoamide acetyltransferase)